jgi:hypothetical protein
MAGSAPRQAARISLVVLGLAGFGEAGHLLFERLDWEAGHHAFHLAYGVGAIVAFAALAVRDVRRNGIPGFSWSLRPSTDPRVETAEG